MALHGSDNRHLGVSPVGSVMTEGYSLDLPLDTVGIFSKDARKTTKKGLKALSNFSNIDKVDENIAIFYGTKKDTGRMGSDKNSRTMDFSLSNVTKVGIAHPKQTEQKFDYWRVGWDGINDTSSFKFFTGQTLEFQMTIGGTAATFFNSEPCYTVRTLINVPNNDADFICNELGSPCDPVDCREHTLTMVKNLNNYLLPGGQKLSDYFDIYPIFDTPVANATPILYNQYCLEYCGFGGEHELSAVSGQYPGVEVKRDTMSGKFVMFIPATDPAPAPYVETLSSILKGCDACPAGYDEIPEGFVYGIALEDDGASQVAAVQALPNAVAGSAVKTGQDFGVGHYLVVLTQELTDAQETTFITANPTAILKFVGTKAAFCENDTETTHAWVACGSCTASTAKYRIMVPDDCNGSRLEEIQDAYPDLTITQVINQNCVSVFETTVQTDFSCSEGCNPALIQQIFQSEAPRMFGLNLYWYPVETAAAPGTTKCGFEIKGKPIVLNPSECTYDELPFIMTSTRIWSLSGGYPVDYSMNAIVPTGTWRVLQLERAQDLDNLGGNLREWEQKGRFYFQDEKPYRNAVSRSLTGTESRLDGLTQYSDLYVTIENSRKAGMNSKEYTYMTYHLLIPYGRTTQAEELFRGLAGAAGLNFEVK
jgi:hypothetical protein